MSRFPATRLISRQLTTQQLHQALKNNSQTLRLYHGIFPVDLLPRYRPTFSPCFIIVNLDQSDRPGSHWVLVFFPQKTSESKGRVFLFDSFGMDAEQQDMLSAFLGKDYSYNRIKLQHQQSQSCGFFVLYVALLLSRGVAPSSVVDYFSRTNLSTNDGILKRAVRKMFQLT